METSEQAPLVPPPKEKRRNSPVPPSKTRPEPPGAASTVKIDAAAIDVENVKNDAASTRFKTQLVFPSVFLRDGAWRASKRKVRDVASLAVLIDAPKRFFANLFETVRKRDGR